MTEDLKPELGPAIPGVSIDFSILHQVQKNISASARHGKALLQQAGQFFSQYKGRGMDFAEVRTYQPGDDIRTIDWRVTARTGKAHTKLFHEERERPIWFAVDQSQSLYFGTQNCFKSVQACLLTAQLAWQAQQLGDCIGSLVFAEASQHYHLPTSGKKGLQALFQFLVSYNQALTNHPSNSNSNSNSEQNTANELPLEKSLKTLLEVCAPGSFVVLISDFSDMTEKAKQQLQQLAKKSHLLCYYLYDPIEAQLPKPQNPHHKDYYIGDGEHELKLNLHDTRMPTKLAQAFKHHLNEITQCVQNAGGHLMQCSTAEHLLPTQR